MLRWIDDLLTAPVIEELAKFIEEFPMEARTVDYGGIGWCVNLLRHGHRMRRAGWNGQNMWIAYVPEGSTQIPQKFGSGLPVRAMLVMKTAQDELVGWLASQSDILASDWQMVDPVQAGSFHYAGQTAGAQGPDQRVQSEQTQRLPNPRVTDVG